MIDTFISGGLRCLRGVASRCSSERGFTLIEALIASVLSIVVFGGILSALESSQNIQAQDTEWALTMQENRAGLSRIAREIRQAYSVTETSSSLIDFLATIGSNDERIYYRCNVEQTGTPSGLKYDECTRQACTLGTGASTCTLGSQTVVVKDVLNPTEVFKYFKEGTENTIAPDLVTVRLVLPASGTLKMAGTAGYSHHVVLSDAAYIRNVNLGT